MYDVATVGILVADVIVKPVEKTPEKGLLSLVDSIELFSGGNAMTAAVNVSKMGLKSAVIGKIGSDVFGDFLLDCLHKNNVETKGVKRDAVVQTSSSVALLDSSGERSFMHCTGADGVFDIADADWDIVEKAKIVFVTGTYLMQNFDGAQTAQFLKKCKEMGKITALDVCWDSQNNWAALLDDAMPYIDLFLPSIDEAKMIAGKDDLKEMTDVFFDKGIGTAVIKCGADGAFLRENRDDAGKMYPTYKNIDVVDTTGAGDSFCSGFLAAYAKGNTLDFCTRFANAAGSHCVMAKGATTGMKSYDEILKFMEERA